MASIKKITIRKLHNKENLGFQQRIELETIHLTLKSDQEMVASYKAALVAYQRVLRRSTRNSRTVEVVHIDSLTDIAWRGLRALIKVMLKHPNEDYRRMSTESYNLINKYGNITKMGYNEKYGNALSLLQDLNAWGKEKQKQINIYDWIVELQTRYDEFMIATRARAKEDAHHITGLMKETRDEIDDAYYTLVKRVNALALVNEEEPYAAFIANVNVIIDEAKVVLASRKTRTKHNT